MSTVDFSSSNRTTFPMTLSVMMHQISQTMNQRLRFFVVQRVYWSFWRAMHESLKNYMWKKVYSWSLALLISQQQKRKSKIQRWRCANRMRQYASTSSCPLSHHISVQRSNPLQPQMICGLLSVWMWRTSQHYRKWTLDDFSRPWSSPKTWTLLLMSQ